MINNRLECFTPLMHLHEYKLIEKYINKDDVFLEWGSGSSTLYFSGLVKKVISIEHDIKWIDKIRAVSEAFNVNNIEFHYKAAHIPDPIPCRYEQFKGYIHYAKDNNLKFTKCLIDGRARKYCAKYIHDIIGEDVIVFIHDFNRPDYQLTLKYYDIIEYDRRGQGIAALKKKNNVVDDGNFY